MPAPEQGAPSSSSSSSVHPLELGATVACTRAGVAGASSVEIIERRRKADNGPWQYCELCYIHRSSSTSHSPFRVSILLTCCALWSFALADVHYAGFDRRLDEWVEEDRLVVEQPAPVPSSLLPRRPGLPHTRRADSWRRAACDAQHEAQE